MAISRGPKIVTNGLVLALDASDNNSFAAIDLPIKDGLVLWLDAADDSTFSYSSGTEVSQWRDKSGNNFHANELQAVGNKPSRNTVVNGRKSLNFTSTEGDRLRVNSGMVFTNSVTAIVFIKPGAQNYDYANILDQDHSMSGGANGWVIQRLGSGSNWQSWVSNAAGSDWFNPNAISYANNTPQIVTLRKGSSTVTLYSNGTSSTDVAIADQQIRQVGYLGLNIGSWRAGGFSDRHYNGEICEIVVYNRALSLTELKQVHTYLGQKWGISNTDRSIVDISGNNNAGSFGGAAGSQTVANMPVYDYYNKGAFKFFANNKYIKLGISTVVNQFAGDFAVSLWAMATAENSNYGNLIGDWYTAGTTTLNEWQIMMNNSSAFLVVYHQTAGTPISARSSGFSANTWINVVLSRVGSTLTLYANNNAIGAVTNSSIFGSTTGNVNIGIDGDSSSERFTGLISNVLIYRKGLTATEVLQNYNAQKSKYTDTIVQQGLVLNLDAGNSYSYGGAGTIFYDVSGNGKIGTLTGGVTYSSLYGGDFILDGVNGYIQTDLNQNTDNAQITWEAWFWDNSPGGFAGNTAIISSYGAVATTPFTLLHIYDNGNPFFSQRNSSGTELTVTYSVNICNGIWHHLVGVVDGTNTLIYVDGILRASQAKVTGTTTSGQNLVIGGNHLGRYQSCRIASARCYNIALSAAQVLQNYNATKSRFGL
jgi:hypothetical protein